MVLYKDENKTISINDRAHELISKGRPRSIKLEMKTYKYITKLVDEIINENCIDLPEDCSVQILNKIPIIEPHKYVGIQSNDDGFDEKMFALTQFLDAVADYSYEELEDDTCEKIIEFLANEMEFNIYFKKVNAVEIPIVYGICLVIDSESNSASVMAFGIADPNKFLFY